MLCAGPQIDEIAAGLRLVEACSKLRANLLSVRLRAYGRQRRGGSDRQNETNKGNFQEHA